MIEFDNFCILHMPRCGGSFIEASFSGAERKTPGHEGWAHFGPFEKDVYGLIRDPASWYLSLHFYSVEHGLPWKEAFGVNEDDDLKTAMKKWITGSHAVDAVVDFPQMTPQNIYRQMRDMDVGLWSWWVLHLYGVNGGQSSDEELADEISLLWLKDREKDISMLKNKYGCEIHSDLSPAIHYARNRSARPDVSSVFDAELMSLIYKYDTFNQAKAILHVIPS